MLIATHDVEHLWLSQQSCMVLSTWHFQDIMGETEVVGEPENLAEETFTQP